MALSQFSICEERGHVIKIAESDLNISVRTSVAAHTQRSVAEHKENCQTELATKESDQTFPLSALPFQKQGFMFTVNQWHGMY